MLTRQARKTGALVATLAVAALCAALASSSPVAAAPDAARELGWEDLIPSGWDPSADLEALGGEDLQDLTDGSDQALELLDAYREAARSAPVVTELDGQRIRIPGYMVPLEFEHMAIWEFLLVPYFGACIHVPPPPANQIVYVTTKDSYPMTNVFKPVWVTGVITTQAHLNEVGDAGYTMEAMSIELY